MNSAVGYSQIDMSLCYAIDGIESANELIYQLETSLVAMDQLCECLKKRLDHETIYSQQSEMISTYVVYLCISLVHSISFYLFHPIKPSFFFEPDSISSLVLIYKPGT